MRAYELRHIVSFEETNLLGNVYFTHYLKWQGRCREMFLREHVPEALGQIADGLRLATVRCSCEYFHELQAFDSVVIRMMLASLGTSSLTLRFEYYRLEDQRETRIAAGEQEIACLMGAGGKAVATAVPLELRRALEPFS